MIQQLVNTGSKHLVFDGRGRSAATVACDHGPDEEGDKDEADDLECQHRKPPYRCGFFLLVDCLANPVQGRVKRFHPIVYIPALRAVFGAKIGIPPTFSPRFPFA